MGRAVSLRQPVQNDDPEPVVFKTLKVFNAECRKALRSLPSKHRISFPKLDFDGLPRASETAATSIDRSVYLAYGNCKIKGCFQTVVCILGRFLVGRVITIKLDNFITCHQQTEDGISPVVIIILRAECPFP